MSLNWRVIRCRKTDAKFPTLKKKSKCRTCDREVSKIRHDGRRIFGQNVVVKLKVESRNHNTVLKLQLNWFYFQRQILFSERKSDNFNQLLIYPFLQLAILQIAGCGLRKHTTILCIYRFLLAFRCKYVTFDFQNTSFVKVRIWRLQLSNSAQRKAEVGTKFISSKNVSKFCMPGKKIRE